MNDLNLDANLLSTQVTTIATLYIYDPDVFFFQGMTNNVRFTFSVGDTRRAVYNKYWARQIELVTPI